MLHLRPPATRHEWVALFFGLFFAAGSAIPLARGVSSLAWPKAGGVITYIDEKPGSRTIGVNVKYRYTSGVGTFTGDRYRFQFILLNGRMESRDVDLAIGRYPVGAQVQVSVNPRDPGDSVLVPGPDVESVIPLGLGLLLILFALAKAPEKEQAPPVVYPGPPAGPRYWVARILAVIGGALFLFGANVVYQGWSSLRWPATDGRILYSHARTGNHYETLLWYEYYVANTRYLAGKYRTGGNATPFRDVAVAAARRYPVGRAVKVYYDPRNPSEALLEPGVWYGNFVTLGIAALLLAAAWLAKKYAEVMARRTPG